MAEMTREQFIKVRMAEGFSKEAAEHAYDHTHDPAIETAQEQKIPTKGEMLKMVHEARQNNPNKKKLYEPNFKLSKKYLDVKKLMRQLRRMIISWQRSSPNSYLVFKFMVLLTVRNTRQK